MAGFLRKIGAVLLSVLLVFSLAACGASDNTNDRGKTEDLSVDGQKNVSETQAATDSTETKTNEEQTSDEVMSDETTGGSDMLVIYFSRTGEQYNVGVIDKGNTAIAAEMIAEQTGADIFGRALYFLYHEQSRLGAGRSVRRRWNQRNQHGKA